MSTCRAILKLPPEEFKAFIEKLNPDPLLKMRDITSDTGFSRQSIYRKVNDGSFPKPFDFGANTARWLTSDYLIWKYNCIHGN